MDKFKDADRADAREGDYKASEVFSGAGPFPMAESLPIMVWTMTSEGILDFGNSAWTEYTGMSTASQQLIDWKALVHPDDIGDFLQQWRDALAYGGELRTDCRLRRSDGKYLWHLAHIVPIKSGRSVKLWLGSMTSLQRQKELEQALFGSEQRFRTLADSAPVLMWIADADKLRSYFNRRWLQFTGRRMEQEQGNGWTHGIHPDDVQHCIDTYVGAFDQREEYQVEYRLKRADGQYRWVLEVGVPIFTPTRQFSGFIGTCIDIDDRKRIEEELRRSRDQLEAIFQGVGDGITVQDPKGQVIFANDAAARFFNRSSAAELIADTMEHLRSGIEFFDEAGLPMAREKMPSFIAARGFKAPEVIMRMRVRSTGLQRWVVVNSTPVFSHEGQVIFIVNIYRDVTHMKHSQEALSFLSDATKEFNRSLDYEETLTGLAERTIPFLADWCFIDMLQEDRTIMRMATSHTDRSKSAATERALEPHPWNINAERGIGYVVRTGKPEFIPHWDESTLNLIVVDPERREIIRSLELRSVMMVPLTVHNRTIGCITLAMAESKRQYTKADLLLAEELADRAALAIENARLYRRSQNALAIRDEFLGIASHELKTPVTSIKAFLQALQKRLEHPAGFDFAKNKEYMELGVKQADRLNAIINDLLDVNRMNQGRIEYYFRVVPIGPLVAEVVERISATFPKRRIALKLQNLTARARLDELRFEQVLTNLLSNAMKYSPEESTTDVSVSSTSDMLRIEIKDRGIGIAPEDHARIFDRYYRTQEAVRSRASGMGIGLFISSQIVRAHGGTLQVESDIGKGSTFIIELPCAEES